MKLLRVIIWKEFQHLRRDKVGLRVLFIMPLAQMLILGYAMTTEVRHTPLAVVDHERSPQSRSLVQALAGNALFRFHGMEGSESALRGLLDRGDIRLALIVPRGFSRDLERAARFPAAAAGAAQSGGSAGPRPGMEPGEGAGGARLQIWVDGQDANSAGVARGYLTAILNQWARGYLEKRLEAQGMRLDQVLPVTVSTQVLFNPQLKSTWYMIPGIAVILITMVTALFTGFSIVREKEAGTLEQLMVTPLKPVHVVVGKAMPFFVLGLLELMFALTLAQVWFRIPFRGNYLVLIAFSAAYMLSSLGIGIFTSTVARTQQQALFIIWFFLLFFLLLSGFFMPVENMPGWVQKITYVNPVRYFMQVLRAMFLKGSGFAELWREGAAMLGIGLTVFTLSVLKFNRQSG